MRLYGPQRALSGSPHAAAPNAIGTRRPDADLLRLCGQFHVAAAELDAYNRHERNIAELPDELMDE